MYAGGPGVLPCSSLFVGHVGAVIEIFSATLKYSLPSCSGASVVCDEQRCERKEEVQGEGFKGRGEREVGRKNEELKQIRSKQEALGEKGDGEK